MRLSVTLLFVCSLFLAPGTYSQTTDTTQFEPVFERVEKEASFPGGNDGWKKFLQGNLNPNVPVDHGAPTGVYTVMMQFVVDKNGKVSGITPLTNLGYGMEQEVMRILRKSGNWEPAQQKGRTVNAYRRQPITFVVMEDGFDISTDPLYAGRDNEISIEVKKVSNENLYVTVSRGTVKRGPNGKFIINVTGTDRVIVKVYNAKKNNKELGTASLEVRQSETETK